MKVKTQAQEDKDAGKGEVVNGGRGAVVPRKSLACCLGAAVEGAGQ